MAGAANLLGFLRSAAVGADQPSLDPLFGIRIEMDRECRASPAASLGCRASSASCSDCSPYGPTNSKIRRRSADGEIETESSLGSVINAQRDITSAGRESPGLAGKSLLDFVQRVQDMFAGPEVGWCGNRGTNNRRLPVKSPQGHAIAASRFGNWSACNRSRVGSVERPERHLLLLRPAAAARPSSLGQFLGRQVLQRYRRIGGLREPEFRLRLQQMVQGRS
jgi:hypothetical protein